MKKDSVPSNGRKMRILQYILEKGSEGASIRETWHKLRADDDNIPIACLISHLDRLASTNQIIEEKEVRAEGHFRRFYDPRYIQKMDNHQGEDN